MAEPKLKTPATHRVAKPKSSLGLVIRPALKMPHDDLIKPLQTIPIQTQVNSSAESAGSAESDILGLQSAAPAESAALAKSADPTAIGVDIWASIPEVTRYIKVLHGVTDHICRMLNPAEQALYTQLYRLSWGFGKSSCFISIAKLAERANIGERTAHTAMKRLTDKGLVVKKRHVFGKIIEQGIEFDLPLPAKLAAILSSAESAAPAKMADIKHNTIKETHTNTAAAVVAADSTTEKEDVTVCVLSRFTLAQCRAYAESLRSEGIKNPGGYATRIHRSGEADDLIAQSLAASATQQLKSVTDISDCPDCRGTGFWYPHGTGKGVAKCRHTKLTLKPENHAASTANPPLITNYDSDPRQDTAPNEPESGLESPAISKT